MYPELKNIKVILANENYKKFPKGFDRENFFINNNGLLQEDTIYLNFSNTNLQRMERIGEGGVNRESEGIAEIAMRETLKTLAHETQHAVQIFEGHNRGGTTKSILWKGLDLLGIINNNRFNTNH